MRLSRPDHVGIAIGLVAALATVGLLFAPDSRFGPVGESLLGPALLLASIPLGGLHNDPSPWLLIPLAALVNAGLWGGLAKLCVTLIRGIVRIRSTR